MLLRTLVSTVFVGLMLISPGSAWSEDEDVLPLKPSRSLHKKTYGHAVVGSLLGSLGGGLLGGWGVLTCAGDRAWKCSKGEAIGLFLLPFTASWFIGLTVGLRSRIGKYYESTLPWAILSSLTGMAAATPLLLTAHLVPWGLGTDLFAIPALYLGAVLIVAPLISSIVYRRTMVLKYYHRKKAKTSAIKSLNISPMVTRQSHGVVVSGTF